VLLGRRSECETLDRLLDCVRAGESRTLVLLGEPGVGKTALLEYLEERASSCRVARAVGVQSEMELAFAGLHQLCAPMLDRLEHLPDPQRDALETAFGLTAGDAPDRFFVGLAVLTLLSDLADEQPLVCVLDDAQWLDLATAQALAFVARRLRSESVAIVFAARTDASEELTGLPELAVDGLGDADAGELLGSVVLGPLDDRVRDRIVAETRGNPLALLELPRGMTAAELAGGFGLPDARPLSSRIEESFLRRLEPLPTETQRLLLVAAAEPAGDIDVVWRTAERLGIGSEAKGPAVEAGLVEPGAHVRFRHPLVRSAAYRAASPAERRGVHRALAEATDAEADDDRRVWHLAHAADGHDADVAEELERSANRAQARGGLAAAAAFHHHAARLTSEPALRARRMLAAAQAKHQAGAPDAALELLAAAEAGPLDELQRIRIDLLRADIGFALHPGNDVPPRLLRAAKRLETLDVGLARETYREALLAALFAGRLASDGDVLEVARAARAAPPSPQPRAPDLLLDGLALLITEGYASGTPTVRRALSAYRSEPMTREEGLRWLYLACHAAMDVWDDESWEVLATRYLQLARDAGALARLPIAISTRTGVDLYAGRLSSAASLIDEEDAVKEATGVRLARYTALVHATMRGAEAEALELMAATREEIMRRGEGLGLTLVYWTTAMLHNSLGRYAEALTAAERACEYPPEMLFTHWGLVELIEAAVRSGQLDRAAAGLEQLSDRTRSSGTDWALGVEARSRALLLADDDAELLYREAIDRLSRTRIRVEHARAHLLYGEWLRRERRRLDAREQLRAAHEMFTTMGLEAFAQRAARELLATGATARKRTVETSGDLTSQEAQIARLARDGLSNPEIGARLFISPRTVQYHLHKVFAKLDITSRNQLHRALPSERGAA
jgi:DNA-binding CsgD family transcriptional regulator